MLIDEKANAELSHFIAGKIRQRVKDPVIAEKLIPNNHGFGTRRVPMETHYYEVYHQPNVRLVDLRETPLERITPAGVKTRDAEYPLDIIIYATGFDAVVGALNRIDVRGPGGRRLKDTWADGRRTYLGLQPEGFPNLFTLVGPHNAASFCNIPRCIEQNVEWLTDFIAYQRKHGIRRVEPTHEAVEQSTAHVLDGAQRMLLSKVSLWFMGINPNLPGRHQPHFLLYAGGLPQFRSRCDEVAADGYRGFALQ